MDEALPPPPRFDAQRLMDELRKGDAGDPEAVALAFREVFDTGLGRLVLGVHLLECGVGNVIGRAEMTDAELRYRVGMHDAAIRLAGRVFDPAALAVMTITGELERSDAYEPDPEGQFMSGLGAVGDADDLS